jgi:hypothetical protein
MKEFILCAALKFGEIVVPGHRHSDCYKLLDDFKVNYPGDRSNQGFLTSENRFVDRKEGWKIAKDNGQIKYGLEASDHDNEPILGLEIGKMESELISENLY